MIPILSSLYISRFGYKETISRTGHPPGLSAHGQVSLLSFVSCVGLGAPFPTRLSSPAGLAPAEDQPRGHGSSEVPRLDRCQPGSSSLQVRLCLFSRSTPPAVSPALGGRSWGVGQVRGEAEQEALLAPPPAPLTPWLSYGLLTHDSN